MQKRTCREKLFQECLTDGTMSAISLWFAMQRNGRYLKCSCLMFFGTEWSQNDAHKELSQPLLQYPSRKKINIQANLSCLSISNLPKHSWSIISVLLMLSYFALHIQSQWLRHINYISIQTAKAWNKIDDKVNNIYINLYNIQYYIIQ
jgi:hypothetical protein